MDERQNVPLNFLVQRMRIIILKKTESTTGISASIYIYVYVYISMYERESVHFNFLVQFRKMRIIILTKTQSTIGISASNKYK